MDDQELDTLLSDLRNEKQSVRERLTEYLDISEELPELLPKEFPESLPENLPEKLPGQPRTPSGKNIRTRDAMIGIFLVLFSVIGVISAIRYGVQKMDRYRIAHSQETAVERLLLPLVLMDIDDFDSPDDLSDEAFLTAGIWKLAVSGKLTDYPEHYGMCTVPQEDVIAAANALFSGNRRPVCKTIAFTGELRFYYDADQSAYVLPCEPVLFTYIPSVTALTEADGIYTARVAYDPEQPRWKQNAQSEPVKTVIYTLRKTSAGWQVMSAKQE